jgi:hypothetical protein
MIAFAKIDVLQLADLVHSAHEDGAWEMDSLRRLYNVEFRDALRPTERKDGLPGLANNICTVRAALPEFPGIGAENLKFQARERYEPGQSINAAFLPIQLGDIFTREDGAEFLLLAQACDIVLRSKGTRTTTFGFMVPVTKTAPHANASETVFVLEWFFSDSNSVPSGSGYAIFKKAFPVPLFALDVAAYNADGNCRLTADDIVPSGLHDAARNRFDRVFKMASALTSVLSPDESIELRAFPHGCQELPGKLTNAKPWTLRFPCQRTGRVAMPYAIAVLTKYTQFLSRTAFERPFGAPVLSEQPDTE